MTSSSSQNGTAVVERNPLALSLAALVCGVYLSAAFWMPERGFWIYDTALKFIQVQAIADHGQLALDWAGRALDPKLDFKPIRWGFYALVGDELHAAYSPVFPLLVTPFYEWLGARGLAVLPLFGAFLGFVAVWHLAGLVAPSRLAASKVRAASVLVAAFATPLWFYALTFWEHAPAASLSCWFVWAFIRYRSAPTERGAVQLGLLAALPIYFRPENYLFAAVVLCMAGWHARSRLREVLLIGGACFGALVPLWFFHSLAFGHPLGLHITNQGWEALTVAGYLADRAQVAGRLLINLHASPGWSFAAAFPFYAALTAGYILRERMPRWLVVVFAALAAASGCVVAMGHLQAPRPMNWLIAANGLFSVSPLLILGFLDFDDSAERNGASARRALISICVAYAAAYALFIPEVNSKGIHWGCRFLLPLYPLLAVLCGVAVVRMWEGMRANRLLIALVTILAVMSVGFQVYSLEMLHDRKAFTVELNRRVAQSDAEVVIADQWFIPVDLVDLFLERPVFYGPSKRRDQLIERLDEAGVESSLMIIGMDKGAAAAGGEIVSDGWLRFSHVTLTKRMRPEATTENMDSR